MSVEDRPWLLRGAVIGIALVVGVVAWVATRDGDEEAAPAPAQAEERALGEAELVDAAALSGHPVYWIGPARDGELEATESAEGSFQVSYPEGGDEAAGVLTIGSYPLADPAGALEEFAARPGSVGRTSSGGREVVVNEESPNSVYFVDPANTVQVEVYDPSPERALTLALSTRVRPVR